MTISDIETIAILVQVDGNCHQVLTSKENKQLLITMLSGMDDGLNLSDKIEPVKFELIKSNQPNPL